MAFCTRLEEKVIAFIAHTRIPHFRVSFPSVTSELIGARPNAADVITRTRQLIVAFIEEYA